MHVTLLGVLTLFVIITGAAALAQFIVLLVLFKRLSSTRQRFEDVLDKVGSRLPPLLDETRATVAETRQRLRQAGDNLVAVSDLARRQLVRTDEVIAEISDRVRLQTIRLDETFSSILNRIEGLAADFSQNITRPVRDFSALLAGLRTGVDFFFRRRTSPPQESHQDEELFI